MSRTKYFIVLIMVAVICLVLIGCTVPGEITDPDQEQVEIKDHGVLDENYRQDDVLEEINDQEKINGEENKEKTSPKTDSSIKHEVTIKTDGKIERDKDDGWWEEIFEEPDRSDQWWEDD